MKYFILIILSVGLCVLSANDKTPKLNLYANYGQSVPISAYRANSNSMQTTEIAIAGNFLSSYNYGLDYFFNEKLGCILGFSYHRFNLNSIVFEQLEKPIASSSYIKHHAAINFHTGITTRFSVAGFNIEPNLKLGVPLINFKFSDLYYSNESNDIYKTINYHYAPPSTNTLSIGAGINLNYMLFRIGEYSVGIQASSNFTYQSPKVNMLVIESDKIQHSITMTEISYRQPMLFVYYGFGIIIKR